MNPDQFKKHLNAVQIQIKTFARKDAPRIAGKVAIDHLTIPPPSLPTCLILQFITRGFEHVEVEGSECLNVNLWLTVLSLQRKQKKRS